MSKHREPPEAGAGAEPGGGTGTGPKTLGGTDGELVTLSTGHEVELPLSTHASTTGAVLSADYEGVAELLPDGLRPVRMTRGRAGVTLLCVEYHRIGHRGEIEPYDEFGVILPAVHESSEPLPYLSVFTHGTGGYVWYLPVTTEPARALGVDIWGFPKVVADIAHQDDGSARRTTVEADGERVVDVTIDRPPMLDQADSSVSYTTRDGHVLRERLELDGDIGVWPYSGAVSYTLGDHPRAERLQELDLGDRALLRFAADAEYVVSAGEPVGTL